MKILVQIRNVYGTEKIYPVSIEALTFAKMLGQTTLTRENIEYIKALGYTVEVAQTTVTTL